MEKPGILTRKITVLTFDQYGTIADGTRHAMTGADNHAMLSALARPRPHAISCLVRGLVAKGQVDVK
jgi:hypothetical protein